MTISGERRMMERRRSLDCERERPARAMLRLPSADLLQLALDGAGAAEQPPVHLIEAVVRSVEHEAARHADGDADRAPVELDCETLIEHLDSVSREQRQARA